MYILRFDVRLMLNDDCTDSTAEFQDSKSFESHAKGQVSEAYLKDSKSLKSNDAIWI